MPQGQGRAGGRGRDSPEEVPACDDQGLGVSQSSALGTVSMERGRHGKAGAGGALAERGPSAAARWALRSGREPGSGPGQPPGPVQATARPLVPAPIPPGLAVLWPPPVPPQAVGSPLASRLPPAAPPGSLAPHPLACFPASPLNKTGRSMWWQDQWACGTQPCDLARATPGLRAPSRTCCSASCGRGFRQRSRRGRPRLSWRNCENQRSCLNLSLEALPRPQGEPLAPFLGPSLMRSPG